MVGLGEDLQKCGGDDLGRFQIALYEQFFPASARHVKAQEFLDLRHGDITVLEYVARFTELARFTDDYVGTLLR